MFKFKEGARVKLKKGKPELGLSAGAVGKVWALYETEPLSYEVTFKTELGKELDVLVSEPELSVAGFAQQKRRAHATHY